MWSFGTAIERQHLTQKVVHFYGNKVNRQKLQAQCQKNDTNKKRFTKTYGDTCGNVQKLLNQIMVYLSLNQPLILSAKSSVIFRMMNEHAYCFHGSARLGIQDNF